MTFLAVCQKCDGYGKIAGFLHIEGGMCFKCEGEGCVKVNSLDGLEEFKAKKVFVNDGGKASMQRYYAKRRAEVEAEKEAQQAKLKCNDKEVSAIFALIEKEGAFSMEQKVKLVLWVNEVSQKDLYNYDWFVAKIEAKKETVK